MSTKTYQVRDGEFWTIERIVEDLSQLVRSIGARITPEECLDDCMQDAWLWLYERLEADQQALGPTPPASRQRIRSVSTPIELYGMPTKAAASARGR